MKEIVYVAAYLPVDIKSNGEKFGESAFLDLLTLEEIEIVQIQNHNRYIWCRDYMPVKSSTGKYVQFTFNPPYMTESPTWKKRIPIAEKIHKELNLKCIKSDIILDGGAIEVYGRKAIVSDRVFRDNKDSEGKAIILEIKEKLELDQLIIIPQYPGEITGHVDGLVRFIDESRVVTNDLNEELSVLVTEKNSYRKKLIENWCYSFKSALINAGLELADYLPFAVPGEKDDVLKDDGIYINFLLLDKLIIMPVYENDNDNIAAEKLEKLYNRPVKKIFASKLANEGGMINCVTWTR